LWDSVSATITSPSFFFRSRNTPVVSVSSVSSPVTVREITLTGDYTQAQNVPVKYHIWSLYDDDDNLIDTTDKVYSAHLSYYFNGLLSGETYQYTLTIVNQDNVEIITGPESFTVSYPAPDISVPPSVSFDNETNSAKVEWTSDRQSIGTASGDITYQEDCPFAGTNSVVIPQGVTITYDSISGQPLEIYEDSFSVIVSAIIDSTKSGKIFELIDEDTGNSYYIEFSGYAFTSVKNDVSTFIDYVLTNMVSGQTVTGVPAADTAYIWDDDEIWNDDYYWTETLPFTKKYKFIMRPTYVSVNEVS
jgi:hypothetical protein